jgi:hypothetical protein
MYQKLELLYYCFSSIDVDVNIRNDGGAGTVVVWVQVIQGSGRWIKSQSLYLGPQASRDLTLPFNEIGFWTTSSISY